MDKAIFVLVFCLSGLSIIASRPDVDESVGGKGDLLHRKVLGIYDRSIGLLLTPHTPPRPKEMEASIRDAHDILSNEFAKISAIALAEYYGTEILKQECNEEPATAIPAEKQRLVRLICEENSKRINPNVEEKIDAELAKVMMRDMQKRFTTAEIKEGCKSLNQLNISQLDRVALERFCVETNTQ